MTNEDAIKFRRETFQLLGTAGFYLDLAQGHLEIGDDAGALYDLANLREYVVKAIVEFRPLRDALGARRAKALQEAAE